MRRLPCVPVLEGADRLFGATAIVKLGRKLALPASAVAHAQNAFHRFFNDNIDVLIGAAAATHLAAKLRECPCKVEKLLAAVSDEFERTITQELIFEYEKNILIDLKFIICIPYVQPHDYIIPIIDKVFDFTLEEKMKIIPFAWRCVNDIGLLPDSVCTVDSCGAAAAAIYLSTAVQTGSEFLADCTWVEMIGVSRKDVLICAKSLLHLYLLNFS